VVDTQKQAVPGVAVAAVHEPSGTRYEATTRADGRFSIPGMRVGGPYTVTASISGFQPKTQTDVVVSLTFADGSIVTIAFSEKQEPIEGVRETFCTHRGDTLIRMDEFQRLAIEVGDRKRVYRSFFRDQCTRRTSLGHSTTAPTGAPTIGRPRFATLWTPPDCSSKQSSRWTAMNRSS
jgi:hypothetical protein